MGQEEKVWIELLRVSIQAFIYITIGTLGFYKAAIYWIDNQVKSDTNFIDTRVSLKLLEENKKLEARNQILEERVKDIEQKFHKYNEDKIRELKDLLKGYK